METEKLGFNNVLWTAIIRRHPQDGLHPNQLVKVFPFLENFYPKNSSSSYMDAYSILHRNIVNEGKFCDMENHYFTMRFSRNCQECYFRALQVESLTDLEILNHIAYGGNLKYIVRSKKN